MDEPKSPQAALEPVEYVQMDDDTLLPFVERPKEVLELVNHPSNEKLFALLKAAFPKEPLRANWKKLHPTEWNWLEFIAHLTTVDRFSEPDYQWVRKTRDSVRERSVALWEKLGVCLGCNSDLLGDDDAEVGGSWGGLGGEEEGEGDGQVWVEGLMASTPTEIERETYGVPRPPSRLSLGGQNEDMMFAEFGDIVERDEEAENRMKALTGMETIGEGEEESSTSSSGGLGAVAKKTLQEAARMTPAQRAGNKPIIDPFYSPSHQFSNLRSSPTRSRERDDNRLDPSAAVGSVFDSSYSSTMSDVNHQLTGSGLGLISNSSSPKRASDAQPLPPNGQGAEKQNQQNRFSKPDSPDKIRSKSFVGLQILTSPFSPQTGSHHMAINYGRHNNGPQTPLSPIQSNEYERERGPGSPLFPGRLDSLSLAPNLGRMASVALNPAMGQGVNRKVSSGMAGGGFPGLGSIVSTSRDSDGDGDIGRSGGRWGIPRKPSGAGLSESEF